MKAQARKILALIMAMVMSLSLAAPAFAAEEAVEDTSAEASVVETAEAEEAEEAEEEKAEAPKAEKKAKKSAKLAAQEDVTYTIEKSTDGSGKYTIKKNGEAFAAGNVTDDKQPKGVTVERVSGGLIGQKKVASYTVTYKYGDGKDDKITETVTVGTEDGDKSFLDVPDSEWKALTEGLTVEKSGKYYQVKGTVYQEPQGNGLYKAYFKLYKADKDANSFKTDEAPLNFEIEAGSELKTADDFSKALEKASQCDVYGEPENNGQDIVKAEVALESATVTDAYTYNAFEKVMNESEGVKCEIVAPQWDSTTKKYSDGTLKVTFDPEADKTTGNFQVSIKATTKKTDAQDTTSYITNVDEAKAILEKNWGAESTAKLESVEAASGNYVTVTVSKKVTADDFATDSDLLRSKNVTYYKSGEKNEALLIDLSKDGWYKGTTKKGANANAVAANTEALGPVIVKKSDVSDGAKYIVDGESTIYPADDSNYLVFDSVEAMQKGIKARSCTAGKTINYVQVILNPWNDTKQNKLVSTTDKKSDEAVLQSTITGITLARDYQTQAWNTPNADFVKKGTFAIEAKEHGTKVETKEVTTAATCEKPGVMTVRSVCQTCKKVVDTRTEEIPVVADPVAKEEADNYKNYAYETKPNYSHYVAKQEDTTSVDTATGMVTVTTTYTCNFGVVHNELTHVETFKKKDLQNSGKWDAISLDKYTALEQYNKQKGDLGLLKTVTVADTDIELTTVPMNRAGTDEFFKFDLRNIDGHYVITKDNNGNDVATWVPVETDANGNYVAYQALTKGVDVYTSVTGLPTTKYYAAKLTVKDIKVSDTDCEDASCTVVVDVYELDKTARKEAATATDLISSANLEENLKNKKVTLVKSYSESVVIPGEGHKFFNSLGQATELCTKCGAKKPKETEATNDLSQATITIDPVKYAGTAMTEKDLNITVKLGKTTLARGIDFEVGELNIKAAGKYTVVVAGKGIYNGRQAIELTVTAPAAAKKQTLKVSVAKKTFKVKTLKKKAQKFTTKLTGAKTAVTWKSSNKKVTVKGSKKKATITVKKGTKKGTYKVTATAKKTGAYKKGTVTVKVIVK